MKKIVVKNVIPFLLALIMFMTTLPFFESIMRLLDQYEPAVEWEGYYLIDKTVKPGGSLHIVYRAQINKQCPAEIRSFLISADGSAVVRFPVLSGGYTRPVHGTVDIPVTIKIPFSADAGLEEFRSGYYIYRTSITRFCPEGIEEDNGTPDVTFYLDTTAIGNHITERGPR